LGAGYVQFGFASRINDTARARIRKGIGAGGDVILSHKGTVGKIAFAPLDCEPFVCSPQTTFWRSLDQGAIDRRYLYYYLCSDDFRRQLDARKGETDMADYVSLTAQRELKVWLPPIEEQRSIGYILGALDDKIELNRRMNQTLESMARATFRSWFVDFDPVVAKAVGRQPFGMSADVAALFPDSFADSVTTPIPSGWREAGVTDLGRFVNGKNFTKNATGSGRLVVRIAELNSGLGASSVYNQVNAAPEYTAYPGDILFAWSGSLDVYRWHRAEALINQHIFKVIPQGLPAWFVYYHLKNAMPFFQGVAADKATTMGHVKRSHLSEWPLAIPGPGLLEVANELIEPLYLGIHLNERTNFTLATLRDTLLPKLMSGELRVRDAEKLVGTHV
jgi:type I restriction enzyme S subunit